MTTDIMLDYDKITTRDIQLIFHHRAWLIKYFDIESIEAFITTNGYHVLIKVREELDPRDVLLVQILMRSDINRDIYNLLRNHEGQLMKNWNRLYTKKYIILGTDCKPVSGETVCPELLERIVFEIDESKDWRGLI